MRVTPYFVSYFNPGGKFGSQGADWNDWMSGIQPSTNLNALQDFSARIESWHNESHHILERATSVPMMDAARNIFFTEFWNLHFLINEAFEVEMYYYGNAAHQGLFRRPSDVVNHIENQHVSVIGRI
jgi:hypothetical protein